ncbi:MAG TPA: hypothetical protein VHM28_06215, partial [Anaerolineales bacterium]|nr:hypothetical protein [Anaerolineales bacterium]
MLATIIIWAYSLGLFYIYGAATVKLSKKFLNLNVEESPSSQITILVGIAVVTTIASYLSILIPLSLLAAAILAAGG